MTAEEWAWHLYDQPHRPSHYLEVIKLAMAQARAEALEGLEHWCPDCGSNFERMRLECRKQTLDQVAKLVGIPAIRDLPEDKP